VQQSLRKISGTASNAYYKGGSTTSKGGNATSKGDRISRGAPHPGGDHHQKQRKMQDNEYNHPTSTMTNCAGPSITIQVTASRVPTQQHLPRRRQQPSPHETNHQIDSQNYHAGSHAVMRGHIQAKLRCIHGPGDPELYRNPKTNRDNIHSDAKANVTT
jgi:hypothetical protein